MNQTYPVFGLGTFSSYDWWKLTVKRTFLNISIPSLKNIEKELEIFVESENFNQMFEELFVIFEQAEAWQCYPETFEILQVL